MQDNLNIYLAQINPKVGDLKANTRLIEECYHRGVKQGADLVLSPELALTGYSPEDLVLSPSFQNQITVHTRALLDMTQKSDTGLILSVPWKQGGKLYHAYLLAYQGKIQDLRYKVRLPNYGVFDEARTFASGLDLPDPILFKGHVLGVMVCEDMWTLKIAQHLQHQGAELLIVLNASPFESGKFEQRLSLAQARVKETGLGLIYLNLVGGQDEVVFDGGSFVLNENGIKVQQLVAFDTMEAMSQWTKAGQTLQAVAQSYRPFALSREERLYQAMSLGLKDYIQKNGFEGVIIGLSGGIDSALTAAVAVDALGANRVRCVMLPSIYTSQQSVVDATECAHNLQVQLDTISIQPAIKAFETMLAPAFAAWDPDVTEENIQARARGLTLMALSNKTGWLVLTTGNKSEVACGFYTLYGDACGGYSVLKDLYKTQVFDLSHWRNHHHPRGALGPRGTLIPGTILTKAPSAELKPGQADEDSLPPYEILDQILYHLIEGDKGTAELVDLGFEASMVEQVEHLLYRTEYKRRQSAPGVKLSSKHLGRDRRYPLTNAFRSHNASLAPNHGVLNYE